jgi:hypothetical protein
MLPRHEHEEPARGQLLLQAGHVAAGPPVRDGRRVSPLRTTYSWPAAGAARRSSCPQGPDGQGMSRTSRTHAPRRPGAGGGAAPRARARPLGGHRHHPQPGIERSYSSSSATDIAHLLLRTPVRFLPHCTTNRCSVSTDFRTPVRWACSPRVRRGCDTGARIDTATGQAGPPGARTPRTNRCLL